MRNVVLGVLFGMFIAVSAMAGTIGYGAHGGLGMAMYDGFEGSNSDLGIHLGADAYKIINDKITANVSLGFATFFVGDEEFATATVSTTLRDIYLEGNCHYMFNDKMYGIAGLGIHMYKFEMDVESEMTLWGTTVTNNYTTDASETKIGITIGGGYILNEKMAVELKYGLISDISQLKATFCYKIQLPTL
jgi:Outer membrane protein beta-barrel domain